MQQALQKRTCTSKSNTVFATQILTFSSFYVVLCLFILRRHVSDIFMTSNCCGVRGLFLICLLCLCSEVLLNILNTSLKF